MKRLIDSLNSDQPRLRAAAQLIQNVPSLADAPRRGGLARLKLRSRRRRSAGWRMHPVVIGSLLLISVAGASAMVDGGWRYARQRVAWLWPAAITPANRSAAVRVKPRSKETAAVGEMPAVLSPLETPAPTAEAAPLPIVSPADEKRAARRESKAAPPRPSLLAKENSRAAPIPRPAADNPEADLMSTIIEARRRGDSATAKRLLGRYRHEFPGGVFIEEALLLSIEAAAVQDRAAAEELARLYLRRFPSGRYRETVARRLRAPAD